MAKQSEVELLAVPGVAGLYSARKGPLRMCAILLTDDSICFVSPTAGLSAGLLRNARDPSRVQFLLAPNHYHNRGLQEFAQAFRSASLCAPDAARPRLERQIALPFAGLAKLAGLLPAHMEFVEPPGLKTGEVWLNIKGPQTRAWLVIDAFRGPAGSDEPPAREPELLSTFPSFGVQDARLYSEWVLQRLQIERPNLLVPCHGTLVAGDGLPAKLRALVQSLT